MTAQLPHDPYITAIDAALTAAGLDPADYWTSDAETVGTWRHLNAVITLDPGTSGLDPDDWPGGLILVWEWHSGREAEFGGPGRGARWEWAALIRPGRNETPEDLPVDGTASPAAVVAAVRQLLAGDTKTPVDGKWDRAAELEAACAAWDTEDGAA